MKSTECLSPGQSRIPARLTNKYSPCHPVRRTRCKSGPTSNKVTKSSRKLPTGWQLPTPLFKLLLGYQVNLVWQGWWARSPTAWALSFKWDHRAKVDPVRAEPESLGSGLDMGVEFVLVSLNATTEIFHLMLLTVSKKPDFVYFGISVGNRIRHLPLLSLFPPSFSFDQRDHWLSS